MATLADLVSAAGTSDRALGFTVDGVDVHYAGESVTQAEDGTLTLVVHLSTTEPAAEEAPAEEPPADTAGGDGQ